jgi:hypothetical protein
MPYPATIQLADLDGSNGYTIPGPVPGLNLGVAVSAAGDINGDGRADYIVSAQNLDVEGPYTGGAYVVFGRSGLAPGPEFDLTTLDGTNGFRILGEQTYSQTGFTLSSAGDVNGDGLDDVMVGAIDANGQAGIVYVVFGRDTAADGDFAADLRLSSLDGSNGYRISGVNPGDRAGMAIAAAGDLNGDGIGDMILGQPFANGGPNGFAGRAVVVFGRADGGDINLSVLDGSNGFVIERTSNNDQLGSTVNGIGDINDDGIDDIAVSAANGDHAYVILGQAGGYAPTLSLDAMTSAQGFEINGLNSYSAIGNGISAAGDFNDDGIDDFVVGAPGAHSDGHVYNGGAFVVFGRAAGSGGFGSTLDLTTLDGTNGFAIVGASTYDGLSAPVRTGDLNADGIDDILVVGYGAPGGSYYGVAYAIFGRAGAGPATVNVSSLDGTQGFAIVGPLQEGREIMNAVAPGDVDGDGLADILVSSYRPDNNTGAAYIIYGYADAADFAGTAGADNVSGGAGRDSLTGGLGNDILRGLGGHDLLDGGDLSDQLFGGIGADQLLGGRGGDLLYGEEGDDAIDGGDGADKLFGGDGQDSLAGDLGNDRFDGGDGIDSLTGGAGNDYLDGGLGADVMTGGNENDVYVVDTAGDQTIEAAGEGYDIVRTALDGWVLSANLEALELQGSGDISGTGNGAANNIQGGSGANSLDGGAGNDTLNGNDGDDTIVGGLGGDLMRGGIGADAFVVAHAFAAGLETDQIFDFSAAENDWIDLSAIDAIAGGFDDAFTLVGAFGKAAGEMTLTFAGGITTLKLDLNGDGKADYQLKINGDVTGESGDWLL